MSPEPAWHENRIARLGQFRACFNGCGFAEWEVHMIQRGWTPTLGGGGMICPECTEAEQYERSLNKGEDSPMKYTYLDCEFVRNNFEPSGLISMGLECNNRTFYAVNADMDTEMSSLDEASRQWMRDNVWPHLPIDADGNLDWYHPDVLPYDSIRSQVQQFFDALVPQGEKASGHVRLSADHGTQDVVRLHTLWDNDWGKMPLSIPKRCDIDLGTLEDDIRLAHPGAEITLPVQDPATVHHALHDTLHDRTAHEYLLGWM